jgi:hypothetical protein
MSNVKWNTGGNALTTVYKGQWLTISETPPPVPFPGSYWVDACQITSVWQFDGSDNRWTSIQMDTWLSALIAQLLAGKDATAVKATPEPMDIDAVNAAFDAVVSTQEEAAEKMLAFDAELADLPEKLEIIKAGQEYITKMQNQLEAILDESSTREKIELYMKMQGIAFANTPMGPSNFVAINP